MPTAPLANVEICYETFGDSASPPLPAAAACRMQLVGEITASIARAGGTCGAVS